MASCIQPYRSTAALKEATTLHLFHNTGVFGFATLSDIFTAVVSRLTENQFRSLFNQSWPMYSNKSR